MGDYHCVLAAGFQNCVGIPYSEVNIICNVHMYIDACLVCFQQRLHGLLWGLPQGGGVEGCMGRERSMMLTSCVSKGV